MKRIIQKRSSIIEDLHFLNEKSKKKESIVSNSISIRNSSLWFIVFWHQKYIHHFSDPLIQEESFRIRCQKYWTICLRYKFCIFSLTYPFNIIFDNFFFFYWSWISFKWIPVFHSDSLPYLHTHIYSSLYYKKKKTEENRFHMKISKSYNELPRFDISKIPDENYFDIDEDIPSMIRYEIHGYPLSDQLTSW